MNLKTFVSPLLTRPTPQVLHGCQKKRHYPLSRPLEVLRTKVNKRGNAQKGPLAHLAALFLLFLIFEIFSFGPSVETMKKKVELAQI